MLHIHKSTKAKKEALYKTREDEETKFNNFFQDKQYLSTYVAQRRLDIPKRKTLLHTSVGYLVGMHQYPFFQTEWDICVLADTEYRYQPMPVYYQLFLPNYFRETNLIGQQKMTEHLMTAALSLM